MKLCIRCETEPPAKGNHSYCRQCANAIMREWRLTHKLSEEERRKAICRSYTKVLVRRGRLQQKPCLICGKLEVQAHHPDYSKPALVVWLCKDHHRAYHRQLKAGSSK